LKCLQNVEVFTKCAYVRTVDSRITVFTMYVFVVFFAMVFYLYFNGNGNGLLFHMTQPISRSTIKAIACSKPTISEH